MTKTSALKDSILPCGHEEGLKDHQRIAPEHAP